MLHQRPSAGPGDAPTERQRFTLAALVVGLGLLTGQLMPPTRAAARPGPTGLPRQNAAQTARLPEIILDAWLAAARRHVAGGPDAETRLVGSWSTDDWWVVVAMIRKGRWDPGGDRNVLLRRGALLHTDIARFGPAPSDATADVALGLDGRYQGQAATVHWAVARALLDEITPDPSKDRTVQLWYRATGAFMLRNMQLGTLTYHLQRARQVLPTDRDILFEFGCLQEGLAAPRVQVVLEALRGSKPLADLDRERDRDPQVRRYASDLGPVVGSAPAALMQAAKAFRTVLEIDAGFAEARLRLGRVLQLQGHHRPAVNELLSAATAQEPEIRYFAELFLGQSEEALGRRDAARHRYQKASALYPRAQSPYLALSALARQSGDRGRSQDDIAPLRSLPAEERARDDPWWSYGRGPINSDALLGEMYSALGGGAGQ